MNNKEIRLSLIVACGQWSSSWLIVTALLATLFGVSYELSFPMVIGWGLAATFSFFLVFSMALCWRRPGRAKVLALVLEGFIIFCGIGLANFCFESKAATAKREALNLVRTSPRYVVLQKEISVALEDYQRLADRSFAQDFKTAARENEEFKRGLRAQIDDLQRQVQELEAGADSSQPVGVATLFSFFW